MFQHVHDSLAGEVAKLKQALKTHDLIRAAVFGPIGDPDSWHAVRQHCPNRLDWQIFDHCAGFTRLYAVYEQFISDLVTEFLLVLPELCPLYANLPDPTRTQHRAAVGQILQKWSEDGRYGKLSELAIVRGLTDGLSAAPAYRLLVEAFLIDPQNYRGQILRRLFSYLGFSDCWPAIKKFPKMVVFIRDHRDATETPETILHDIVERRNSASHSNITEVVAVDELSSYADFVVILADALAGMVTREVWRRRIQGNQAVKVGTVIKDFGRAIGIALEPGTISIGEELVVQRDSSLAAVNVLSIQKGDTAHDRFESAAGEELGLKVNGTVKEGAVIFRMPGRAPNAAGAAPPP